MRNKKCRGAVLLLSGLLLLGGCASPAPDVSDGPITLTAMQYELENQSMDCDSMWFYRELEKETGVHVEFEEVVDADWTMRQSLMFSSGDLKDLILRGSLDTEEYGVTQHLLVPLEDYLPACMPVYYARLKESGLEDDLRSSDGHIYYVGFLLSQGVNTDGHFFINREWLDTLDLEVPRTVDELTDVLRAFRDGDPNKNGLRDEIPWEATFDDTNTGLYNSFGFFGLPLNKDYVFLSEGRVSFAPLDERFRACADWLHTLMSEGLIDLECLTQGSSLWSAKVNRGTTGFFSYWRLGNSALKSDIAARYECMLPVGADCTPCLPRIKDVVEFGAALTVQNGHIEETLRWLDAQFETETMLIAQNGPVGEMLGLRDDGRYEVIYVPGQQELLSLVPVICGQFFAPEEYYGSVYVPAAHRIEKKRYSEMYEAAGVLEKDSYYDLTYVMPMTAEENTRIRLLKNQLKSAVDEGLVMMVTRGVDDEGWQAFCDSLTAAGAAEYAALYQQAYDRLKGAGTP